MLIDLGRVTLGYRASGEPGAPPMVLLHGGREDASTWDGVVPELAAGHRVYAVDLRGHGDSDRPGEYSFELMRDDVCAFLEKLDLRAATMIGHSMGGVVAYLTALELPGRVAALVLEETPPPMPLGLPVPEDSAVRTPIIKQLNDPDPRWWQRIPEFAGPALLIGGGEASFLPQDLLAGMARRFPNGRFVTIPVGHRVHRHAPAEFLRAIRD